MLRRGRAGGSKQSRGARAANARRQKARFNAITHFDDKEMRAVSVAEAKALGEGGTRKALRINKTVRKRRVQIQCQSPWQESFRARRREIYKI